MKKYFTLSFCLLFQMGMAQILPAGPQVLSFRSEADDSEQPYGFYLPENYNPQKKYPLVIMLHGAGSNHRLALRRVFGKSNTPTENDVEASRYFPAFRSVDYLVASPLARGTMGYQGVAEKDVLDVLADVKSRFSVDEDRVYLTGLSMGGGGTMWIGLAYPHLWAAIAPVCPAPPDGMIDLMPNGAHLPMHFFQGAIDPVVKADSTKRWIERLKAEGTLIEYAEYEGVQHDSWVNAYQNGFIFDWFAKHQRNRFPDKLTFATRHLKHNRTNWFCIDRLVPGKVGRVEAIFTNKNQLKINTLEVNGLTLMLAGHPKFAADKRLELLIDGNSLQITAKDSVFLSRDKGKWKVLPQQQFALKSKGASGPLSEAVADRHLYVYGTADTPNAAVLEKRRLAAETAANWSAYRGDFLRRILFFPRVVSDKEVRASDWKTSNLILFGTEKTNSCIAKIASKLPMRLTDSTDNYGLVYIFPNEPNKYVLVNSGINVMDAPHTDVAVNPLRRMSSPAMMLAAGKFKDFALYNKDKVLINNYFDENWKLSEEDIKILKKTTVIRF